MEKQKPGDIPQAAIDLEPAGFLERMGIAALTTPLVFRDKIREVLH